MRDARPLGLITRWPTDWWWTFAIDRCYPVQGRHVPQHTCRLVGLQRRNRQPVRNTETNPSGGSS